MLQAKFERVLPRLLAEISQDRDVAANQGLQAGADGSENRTRAHNNPPYDTEGFNNAIARQFKCRGSHGRIHERNLKAASDQRNPIRKQGYPARARPDLWPSATAVRTYRGPASQSTNPEC